MCVIGLELGDGMSCREENERQYFCSGVLAPGPRGSFSCWMGRTSAAMIKNLYNFYLS